MTENSESASTPAENSGFVEHLRIVHFTLIAACLILCIAVTSQTRSSATRAYEQTIQLQRIQTLWHNGQWLDRVVSQQQAITADRMQLPHLQDAELELADPKSVDFNLYDYLTNGHQTFDLHDWV